MKTIFNDCLIIKATISGYSKNKAANDTGTITAKLRSSGDTSAFQSLSYTTSRNPSIQNLLQH